MGFRQNSTHSAVFPQLSHDLVHNLLFDMVLNGHTHMHLTRTDQIYHYSKTVQSSEYPSKEAMRDTLPIRVNVEHGNALLDSDSSRKLLSSL